MAHTRMHFNSTQAYADWALDPADPVDRQPHQMYYRGLGSENGRSSVQRARDGALLLSSGTLECLDEANKLLNEFQERIEVPTYTWEHSMAGAFPDVPTFLAGIPDAMYAPTPTVSEHTPLRVWAGVMSTWSITEAQLRRRGAALAAFVIAMYNVRPVYITPFTGAGSGFDRRSEPASSLISWDIQTSPLVMSQLLASLTHPSVTRYLCMPANYKANHECDNPSWPFHPYDRSPDRMREALGCAPGDLYIPSIHQSDPLLDNPVQWLREHIARYSTDPDEETL